MLELQDISTSNKLKLLFVFDKLNFPMLEENILSICSNDNTWLSWIECKETLGLLLEAGFVYQSIHENKFYYTITTDGSRCLAHFYTRIPSSDRIEIDEYIKQNRMNFKRKQEYFRNYYKNADDTYTVHLKISDPAQVMLDIKINVANRQTAKTVYNKWEEKAAQIYYSLHEQLID